MTKTRLEAFSDGVFAIAITLLILNVTVPDAAPGRLAHDLAREWPAYVSYLVSFVVIGIIWVNHHRMLDHLQTAHPRVLFANLALLATVAFIPFPTSLMADYLREGGSNAHLAAAVYSVAMMVMGIAFQVLWRAILREPEMLIDPGGVAETRRRANRALVGIPIYLAAVGVAFISAAACLAFHAVLAAYYVLEGSSSVPDAS